MEQNKAVLRLLSQPSSKPSVAYRILSEQIALLYQQNALAIAIQLLACLILVFALWQPTSQRILFSWLVYMLIVSALWLRLSFYYRVNHFLFKPKKWLLFFALFTFLSSLGWGFAGSILITLQHISQQAIVVFLLFAITAGAIFFFTPMLPIYALFFFPAFIPFNIWLFYQGEPYIFLAFAALIYMPLMFISCYYSNKFLITALTLRNKNISLDTLNQLLEKQVFNRTQALEKSLTLTQSTLESTTEGILVLNKKGEIEYCNKTFLALWLLPTEFRKTPLLSVFITNALPQLEESPPFLAQLKKIKTQWSQKNYIELNLKQNKCYEWLVKPHRRGNYQTGQVWSFHDVSLKKQMEYQLTYQANHDLLTGLPNRTLLCDRINQGITYAKRYQTKLMVLLLDLDNFKLINNNLGHQIGDSLLQEISKRLLLCTRESDTVARLSSDEFVILFISNQHQDVLFLAQKILDQVAQPINLPQHEIIVTASIGVSNYPQNGNDSISLLKNADMAMSKAKSQGGNNFKLYNNSIKHYPKKSLELQIALRNALVSNEFFLLYQPIVDLRTQQIIAVETLVRWKHPRKGIIYPLEFIPIAEKSRIIILLGEWIFRNAFLQNKAWQDMGLRPIKIAINVSAVQLLRDNFAQLIELSLADCQLEAKYVELELTESTVMDDKKQNLYTLKRLKGLGLSLSIDDFGTGYSSLNSLKEFPVNKLKIDQSFVQNCTKSSQDASIIKAIITMGHELKLSVLAEGIETQEQLQFLEACHCDEGQGFLYGHPMDAKALAKLLKSKPS